MAGFYGRFSTSIETLIMRKMSKNLNLILVCRYKKRIIFTSNSYI